MPNPRGSSRDGALRAQLTGVVQGVGLRESTRRAALELGLSGWVRNEDDGSVRVHAEGDRAALEQLVELLRSGPGAARVDELALEEAKVEGHEQFAIRGLSAGEFVVQEHQAGSRHFDLRLQVGDAMRSWALPKGPSMDPAVKRLAVQVEDHSLAHNSFEGATEHGGVIVWDRGSYEQGGRVPWPEAIDRGHAVFVLHGRKLQGGFALQRTREGSKPQWLLLKRRDESARSGWDVVAEHPASVVSGRTLDELLDGAPDRR